MLSKLLKRSILRPKYPTPPGGVPRGAWHAVFLRKSDLGAMRAKPRNFHHFLIENALDLALVYVVRKGDKLSDYE
jgi:hypothetical protein